MACASESAKELSSGYLPTECLRIKSWMSPPRPAAAPGFIVNRSATNCRRAKSGSGLVAGQAVTAHWGGIADPRCDGTDSDKRFAFLRH